jgi:hypothetical protein
MTLVYSLAKKGAGCMTTWLIDKDIVKAVVIFLFDEIFFSSQLSPLASFLTSLVFPSECLGRLPPFISRDPLHFTLARLNGPSQVCISSPYFTTRCSQDLSHQKSLTFKRGLPTNPAPRS